VPSLISEIALSTFKSALLISREEVLSYSAAETLFSVHPEKNITIASPIIITRQTLSKGSLLHIFIRSHTKELFTVENPVCRV